jgi:hypothetical protein
MKQRTTSQVLIQVGDFSYNLVPSGAELKAHAALNGQTQDGKPAIMVMCLYEHEVNAIEAPVVFAAFPPGKPIPAHGKHHVTLFLGNQAQAISLYEMVGETVPQNILDQLMAAKHAALAQQMSTPGQIIKPH